MLEEVAKEIKKSGVPVDFTPKGAVKRAKTVCQGCGAEIFSDDKGDVDYAKSKRGSTNFWHRDCFKQAWNSKIKSVGR